MALTPSLNPPATGFSIWRRRRGQKSGHDFTYEDMYVWLGYIARRQIYEVLDEALNDDTVEVEMFAYDFNDPGVAQRCLGLAAAGRIRIILDNAALHTTRPESPRRKKTISRPDCTAAAAAGAELFRCRFARYSHCKIIILKKNGAAFRVLTGSTNFSITGLCVNANHVLLFDRPNVAKYYSDVFNNVWQVGKAAPFPDHRFLNQDENIHRHRVPTYRGQLLATRRRTRGRDSRPDHGADTEALDKERPLRRDGNGRYQHRTLIRALRDLHKNDSIYTYGVTDNSSGDISLYKPGRKNGLLIDASQAKRELPPPFKTEALLPGHAIHHKFVITNFNRSTARVWWFL